MSLPPGAKVSVSRSRCWQGCRRCGGGDGAGVQPVWSGGERKVMAVKRADHPNVIVFFTDQQRWDTAGVHGNPLDLMPNFDRMARRGTHVFSSFTCQPVCGPARSALQTGLYPTTT